MEGVSEGCASTGQPAVGVLVPSLFRARDARGNAHLTEAVNTPSLLSRIDAMVQRASCFVAMRGTLGTLTELAAALNIATLAPLGGYAPPLIVAWRDPWEGVLTSVVSALRAPGTPLAHVTFVDSVAEAVEVVVAHRARGGCDAAAGVSGAGAAPV